MHIDNNTMICLLLGKIIGNFLTGYKFLGAILYKTRDDDTCYNDKDLRLKSASVTKFVSFSYESLLLRAEVAALPLLYLYSCHLFSDIVKIILFNLFLFTIWI